jgi:hypothetical protein
MRDGKSCKNPRNVESVGTLATDSHPQSSMVWNGVDGSFTPMEVDGLNTVNILIGQKRTNPSVAIADERPLM